MKYIIFDLEATCWKNEKRETSEIIEVGAVKLDENLEKIDEFAMFVKPVLNPELSEFCTELTKIEQNDVDNAKEFEYVMKKFEDWIEFDKDDFQIYSWGFYDKSQIKKEAELKKYSGRIINILKKHDSLKHKFSKIKDVKPCGMAKALDMLDIPLDGTHHRGIDDARNISKIFINVHEFL